MKIMHKLGTTMFTIVVSAMFIGCGGGSDSTQTPTTYTGTFIDAPVKGLTYKTASQSGYTNENGEYKYRNGEEIEFMLSNIPLGKMTAGVLATPYSICSNDAVIANSIALLLQNFDANRSNKSSLDLTQLQDFNFTVSDFNLSNISDIESKVTDLLATGSFQSFVDSNNSLIDAATVKAALDAYIAENSIKYDKKFTTEYLTGKTLYFGMIDYQGEVSQDDWIVTAIEFSDTNATLVFDFGADGNDTTNAKSYEIVDGALKITDGDRVQTHSITAIDEDKITTTSSGETTLLYFSKDAAVSYVERKTLEGKGFTQLFLAGNTLYFAMIDYQGEVSQDDWIVTAIEFSDTNATLVFDFGADGNDTTNAKSYEIVDGALKITDGDRVQTHSITAIDEDKITTTSSGETTLLYFSKDAAVSYVESL